MSVLHLPRNVYPLPHAAGAVLTFPSSPPPFPPPAQEQAGRDWAMRHRPLPALYFRCTGSCEGHHVTQTPSPLRAAPAPQCLPTPARCGRCSHFPLIATTLFLPPALPASLLQHVALCPLCTFTAPARVEVTTWCRHVSMSVLHLLRNAYPLPHAAGAVLTFPSSQPPFPPPARLASR